MNKYRWHLDIIPEDEAHEDIAKGFRRQLPQCLQRQVSILPPQGGYGGAFAKAEEAGRCECKKKIQLVLVDFDGRRAPCGKAAIDDQQIATRVNLARKVCDKDVSGQTFVLGPFQEAEKLCGELGPQTSKFSRRDVRDVNSKVKTGMLFASENMVCDESLWQCGQLAHSYNHEQMERLCALLRRKLVTECMGAHMQSASAE